MVNFIPTLGGWSDEMEYTGEWLLDGGEGCSSNLASEVELPTATGPQSGNPLFPDLPGPRTTEWISLGERRALFELTAYVDGISAVVKNGLAKVRGGGCAVDVPLIARATPSPVSSAAKMPGAR